MSFKLNSTEGYDNICLRCSPCLLDPAVKTLLDVATIATIIALLIIGSMGAAGTFPNISSFGWTVLWLSVGAFGLLFASRADDFKGSKNLLITAGTVAAVVAILGGLGVSGVLTMRQIGTGFLITFFTGPLLIYTTLHALNLQTDR